MFSVGEFNRVKRLKLSTTFVSRLLGEGGVGDCVRGLLEAWDEDWEGVNIAMRREVW